MIFVPDYQVDCQSLQRQYAWACRVGAPDRYWPGLQCAQHNRQIAGNSVAHKPDSPVILKEEARSARNEHWRKSPSRQGAIELCVASWHYAAATSIWLCVQARSKTRSARRRSWYFLNKTRHRVARRAGCRNNIDRRRLSGSIVI